MKSELETRAAKTDKGWQDHDGFVGPFQPGNGPRSDPRGDFPTGPDVGEVMPDEVRRTPICEPPALSGHKIRDRLRQEPPSHLGHRLLDYLTVFLLITTASMTGAIGRASAQDDTAEIEESAGEFEVYRDDEVREGDEPPESGESSAPDEAVGIDEAAEGRAPKLTEEEHKNLEVLFVTGKQGSRDLQDLPEAISSFSSADLLAQGITDFNTLQFSVPSLFSGGGLTKITLRGVGSEVVGPGIDPGFSVHINNVFSSRETTGLTDYFDIERVDILRGPQGTLWGRNSTGGAMNVITNKPLYGFDANLDIEYGAFDGNAHGVRARGMVNAPPDRRSARGPHRLPHPLQQRHLHPGK
jgi:outer membrane receptor protein involved in Fe transport